MRSISLDGKTPPAEWLAKSASILEQLKAAKDKAARDAIIDGNSAHWGALKDWLLEISHQKCWFSEAKDVFNHWHVEHFRPKKSARDLEGDEVEGYWWLSFDWTNYRICGSVGNSKKGSYFPLRAGCLRVGIGGDIRLEDPVLLDPSDPDDPNLLSFNQEGEAIASPFIDDAWERHRAEVSIKRFKLDHDPLVQKRKIIWSECHSRISRYCQELATYKTDPANPIARHAIKEAAKQVRKLLAADEEFSAVARACVLFEGDERVKKLLAT